MKGQIRLDITYESSDDSHEINSLTGLSSKELAKKIYLSYFSSKTYVVGTQKNRLNETVLLSTQNIC